MNKRNRLEEKDSQEEIPMMQNSPPKREWGSFEIFWSSCVKNGSPLLKDAFRAHLKALGWLNKPEKFIDGALHFGLKIEK